MTPIRCFTDHQTHHNSVPAYFLDMKPFFKEAE